MTNSQQQPNDTQTGLEPNVATTPPPDIRQQIQADLAHLRKSIKIWTRVDLVLVAMSIVFGISATILAGVAGASTGGPGATISPPNGPSATAGQTPKNVAGEIAEALGGWRSTCYFAMLSAGLATGATAFQRGFKTEDYLDQAHACKGKLTNLELKQQQGGEVAGLLQEYAQIKSDYTRVLP